MPQWPDSPFQSSNFFIIFHYNEIHLGQETILGRNHKSVPNCLTFMLDHTALLQRIMQLAISSLEITFILKVPGTCEVLTNNLTCVSSSDGIILHCCYCYNRILISQTSEGKNWLMILEISQKELYPKEMPSSLSYQEVRKIISLHLNRK